MHAMKKDHAQYIGMYDSVNDAYLNMMRSLQSLK
jgi:hypothetical protein